VPSTSAQQHAQQEPTHATAAAVITSSAATAPTAKDRREDDNHDDGADNPAKAAAWASAGSRLTYLYWRCSGELELELLRKRLGQKPYTSGKTCPVAIGVHCRPADRVPDATGACIGYEPLRTGPCGNRELSAAVTQTVAGHEQHDDARIASTVACLAYGTDLPLPAYVSGNLDRWPAGNISEGDDRNLTA